MAIKIPNQQTQQPVQQTQNKSQREIELENQIQAYEQELQKLVDKNYLANLKDDTFFRVELLSSLNHIAMVFQNFLNELKSQ